MRLLHTMLRTGNLDRIPAAVVNLDQIVTSGTGDDAQTIAAGMRAMSEKFREGGSTLYQ